MNSPMGPVKQLSASHERKSYAEASEKFPQAANTPGQEFAKRFRSDKVCVSDFQQLCTRALKRRLFVVKLRLRDNESVNEAVRRFRKLVEHAGVKKEMRKREFYEKPSDMRLRDRRRAEMRARRANQEPTLDLQ